MPGVTAPATAQPLPKVMTVPLYDFRCADHGVTSVRYAMSEVPATSACPTCSVPMRRRFTSPALGSGNTAASRTIEATQRTAETPGVVSSLPTQQRPTRPVSHDPRHAKLPRP